MCNNGKCPSKEICYRFKTTPGIYQTYSDFEVKMGEDRCEDFMEIYKTRKQKREEEIDKLLNSKL